MCSNQVIGSYHIYFFIYKNKVKRGWPSIACTFKALDGPLNNSKTSNNVWYRCGGGLLKI